MKISQLSLALKRHWYLFVLLVVIACIFGSILMLTRPKTYEASTIVQVSFTINNPVEGVSDYDTRATIFNTIIEASTTNQALRDVGSQNGWDIQDLKEIRQAVKVFQVNRSEFIKITVDAKTEKQAVDTTNSIANYIRNFSNQRWAAQLKQTDQFTVGQLKLAQDNYDQARKTYDDAAKKFKDLQDEAQNNRQKNLEKQLQDATDGVQKAKNAYTAALARPDDIVTLEIAKNDLERAQRSLETAQLALVTPIDKNEQTQLNDTLNQVTGLDAARNNLQATKAKLDDITGSHNVNTLLFSQPDFHVASVNVLEVANSTDPQSRQIIFYIGLSAATAVVLCLFLLLALLYFNRSIYSLAMARNLYNWPVIGTIPQWKNKKIKKLKGPAKGNNGATPLLTPELATESYRQLAYKLITNHQHDLKQLFTQETQLLTETTVPTEVRMAKEGLTGEATVLTNGNLKNEQHVLIEGHAATLVRRVNNPSQPEALRFLVTSSRAGTGTTSMVRNLGIALAEAGCPTLLVDCNRKGPKLPGEFGLEDSATPGKVYSTEVAGLDVLPYNSLPFASSGVVRLTDLNAFFASLPVAYNFVICDAPAFEDTSDALVLAQYFQNVLFVVNGQKPLVETDHERLGNLLIGRAQLEGLVVNRLAH